MQEDSSWKDKKLICLQWKKSLTKITTDKNTN